MSAAGDDPRMPRGAARAVPAALLVAVLAGMSMIGPFSIDTPFPAFPAMRGEFAASTEQMQFVVSAYMFAFAAMTPLHGPFSDALGRKRVIIGGLSVYLVASVGCALSGSLPVLLGFRVLQGLSAGAATIIGRTIIRDLFDGAEAHRVMSRVMMVFGVAPAVAPVVGGWLLQIGSWHLVFWFMALFAGTLAVVVFLAIPETHPPERRAPFRPGPMAHDLGQVARDPAFLKMAFAMSLSFAGQFLYIGGAAIFVGDLLGLGEQDYWVLFVPMISGIVAGAWLSGRAAGRVSSRRLVLAALSFSAVAAVIGVLLAAVFGPVLPYAVVGPALIALGTGTAFPAVQIALLDRFPARRGAAASVSGVIPLALNALLAVALTPFVGRSVLDLALAALVLIVAGLGCWVWHLRGIRA